MLHRVAALAILVTLAACAPRTRAAQSGTIAAGVTMMLAGMVIVAASDPFDRPPPPPEPGTWGSSDFVCQTCGVVGLGIAAVGAIVVGSSAVADMPDAEPTETYAPVEVAPVTCTVSGGCR